MSSELEYYWNQYSKWTQYYDGELASAGTRHQGEQAATEARLSAMGVEKGSYAWTEAFNQLSVRQAKDVAELQAGKDSITNGGIKEYLMSPGIQWGYYGYAYPFQESKVRHPGTTDPVLYQNTKNYSMDEVSGATYNDRLGLNLVSGSVTAPDGSVLSVQTGDSRRVQESYLSNGGPDQYAIFVPRGEDTPASVQLFTRTKMKSMEQYYTDLFGAYVTPPEEVAQQKAADSLKNAIRNSDSRQYRWQVSGGGGAGGVGTKAFEGDVLQLDAPSINDMLATSSKTEEEKTPW